MSSTTTERAISINRYERDVLRRLLELELSGDGFSLDDAEAARTQLQKFNDWFALLDRIGWEQDDPRETFELPVDDGLRRFLEHEKEGQTEYVADEAHRAKRVRAREDGMLALGKEDNEAAWREAENDVQKSLDGALEELHAIDAVRCRALHNDEAAS